MSLLVLALIWAVLALALIAVIGHMVAGWIGASVAVIIGIAVLVGGMWRTNQSRYDL